VSRGANTFKHLQTLFLQKNDPLLTIVGSFVGMLFHNGAQSSATLTLIWDYDSS
jgi:hypothetical protein